MNAIQFFDYGYLSNKFDYSIKIDGVESNVNIVDIELYVYQKTSGFADINNTHSRPNAPKTFIQQKINLSQSQIYKLNKQVFINTQNSFDDINTIKNTFKSLSCILFFNTENEMRNFYTKYSHPKMKPIQNNYWYFKDNGYFTVMIEQVPFTESLSIHDKQYNNKNLFKLNFTKK